MHDNSGQMQTLSSYLALCARTRHLPIPAVSRVFRSSAKSIVERSYPQNRCVGVTQGLVKADQSLHPGPILHPQRRKTPKQVSRILPGPLSAAFSSRDLRSQHHSSDSYPAAVCRSKMAGTTDAAARDALVEDLLATQEYHIEFNGFLTNHLKHAVVALNRLQASPEQLKENTDYYKNSTYGFGLEPPRKSEHTITEENWKEYFGLHSSFTSYCDFFDRKEKELGMEAVLKEYGPALLPGVVGSLTHSMIHLGWALDSKHRWMIIEGLAYAAFSFLSCHPEKSYPGLPQTTVLDSLLHVSEEFNTKNIRAWVASVSADPKYKDFQPVLAKTGIQFRIAKLLAEGHPLIHGTPAWIDGLKEEDIPGVFEQLYYGFTLFYLAVPGNFVALHILTALWGIEHISQTLPFEQRKMAIKCFWTGILAVGFSTDAGIPPKDVLVGLHEKFSGAVDGTASEVKGEDWESVVGRAVKDYEEHNPKLVYVMREVWARYGKKSVYREAATHFTVTPNVGKNVEFKA
ncbi:hypothetical protein BSKO_12314 [Bryopsis sp. KO-2023]|nr:hypothetical protein BSKO_12314 [Bryopsis sp. KO-2023]